MNVSECPLANIQVPAGDIKRCPFHAHHIPNEYKVQDHVPLSIKGGSHSTSIGQAALLADIGGGDRIREKRE